MSSLSVLSVLLSAVLLAFLSAPRVHSASLTFTQQCASAPFSGRSNGNVESLSRPVTYEVNGQRRTASTPLVLQGSDNVPAENDVWLSPDDGRSWYLLAGISRNTPGGPHDAPGTAALSSFTTIASAVAFTTDSLNNIFRIQGQVSPQWPWDMGTCTGETWMSMDGGVTWQMRGSATPTPARKFASAISDANNNLYLMGGHQCPDWATQYDVWMSANQGSSWQRQALAASVDGPAVGILLSVPVAPRATGLGTMRDALVYTTGWNGLIDYNTVFISTTQGVSWQRYTGAAAFQARDDANGEVTREGLMIVVGGKHEFTVNGNITTEYFNDVWVSPDGGWTWGLCVEDAVFSDRRYFMTALDQAGYLYVIGGANMNQTRLNDVYRSSISFHNATAVQQTCGISMPPCGYGIVCLPGDETTRPLPRGVTCTASQLCGGAVLTNTVDFTSQTTRAPWSPRSSLFVGRLPEPLTYPGGTAPANSFILHGNENFRENDVWISTDRMQTWTIIAGVSIDGIRGGGTAPAPGGTSSFTPPVARGPAYSIATANGNNRMFRISGETTLDEVCSNHVWTSQNGYQWSVITVANSWTPRIWSQSVVSPRDGSVYLFGGRSCGASGGSMFDVWRSANNGQTWNRQSNNFPANGPRNGMSGIWYSPTLGREIITYASGWGGDADYNDVVVSSDQGVTWEVVTTAATWVRRDDMAGLVTPDGVIIVVGGKTNRPGLPEEFHNDIWVSMDGGYSFGRCNEDNAFSDRRYMTATLDEQGHLYIIGGQTNDRSRTDLLNDAWRSTLSFSINNLDSISASCNVTVPQCGAGLNCWPRASGTQRLPGNKGVTCPACPTRANVDALDFIRQTGNAPFSARSHGNVELFNKAITYTPVGSSQSVTIPRNALILQGTSNGAENDVWASTDHGENWMLIAGKAVYSRSGAVSATPPADTGSFSPMTLYTAFAYDSISNYIYRVGGYNPMTGQCWAGTQYSNDAKRWVNINSGTGTGGISPAREYAAAITDSKGYLYVTGGRVCGQSNGLEDVWRSTDRGATWTRRIAYAPWGFRLAHLLLNVKANRLAGQPDVLISMGGWTGGSDRNDVWASSDGGAKWEPITLGAAWSSRDDMNGEVTPAGLLIVTGGKSELQVDSNRITEVYNDVWVSADGGYTWGVCISDASFVDRRYQMTVLDEQGYLLIIGGVSASEAQLNDVYRSSISFTNLPAVQRACGITIPVCGVGLSCLPSSPGFRRLPGNLGVTCDACRNPVGYNRMDFIRLSAAASWSPRSRGNAELMKRPITWRNVFGGDPITSPANALVLQGNSNYRENDVWISTDHGVVWELIAGWSLFGRTGDRGAYGDAYYSSFTPDTYAPAFTQDSASNIYRIHGEISDGGNCSSAVWMSTNGIQWANQYTASTTRRITPTRLYAGAIGDSKGNIYVAGGRPCTPPNQASQERNDVWMSSDRGKSWTQQTERALWPKRAVFQLLSHTSRVLQKDALVVFAGWSGTSDYNDVWASSDQGRSWRILTANAPWMSRDDANAEITANGLIVLTSGKAERQVNGVTVSEILNDVWVSADGGYTWGSCLQDASYSDRRYQMTLLDDLDFLYVIGGSQSNGRELNDVWRSSISFRDLNGVQAACGIKIPPCGAGLNCWYNSPGFSWSKQRGATCDACEAVACVGPDCPVTGLTGSSTGGAASSSSGGLGTGAILAIVILVALGVAGAYFGYRYWNRIGADATKSAEGLLANESGGTKEAASDAHGSTNGATNGTNGTHTAATTSQPTV